VREGDDARLPQTEEGRAQHRLDAVYGEMLIQISLDFAGLPDPRELTLSEIRFFYNGLREILKQRTKPNPSS
jgi:hypothetical protein